MKYRLGRVGSDQTEKMLRAERNDAADTRSDSVTTTSRNGTHRKDGEKAMERRREKEKEMQKEQRATTRR